MDSLFWLDSFWSLPTYINCKHANSFSMDSYFSFFLYLSQPNIIYLFTPSLYAHHQQSEAVIRALGSGCSLWNKVGKLTYIPIAPVALVTCCLWEKGHICGCRGWEQRQSQSEPIKTSFISTGVSIQYKMTLAVVCKLRLFKGLLHRHCDWVCVLGDTLILCTGEVGWSSDHTRIADIWSLQVNSFPACTHSGSVLHEKTGLFSAFPTTIIYNFQISLAFLSLMEDKS